jgi:hypothetical protein
MRSLVTALAVVAAFALGVYVGIRYEREPEAPAAGGVWLADGPAGQMRSDERKWSNCGVAVRPDLSDELVVCRFDGDYQCYSPGDSTDPETWVQLEWNERCSRARDSLVAKRVIMTL